MPHEANDLPFGDAFSPAQLSVANDEEELSVILDLVHEHKGNPLQFDHAIAERFFSASPDPNTRAENVRFALKTENGYGIVNQGFEFTDVGEKLYELRTDPEALYDRFAEHILLSLHGIQVIETIRDLEALGKQTTEHNIREHLANHYGIRLGEASNHWSQMRAWLAKAGLINTGVHIYEIDDEKVADLTGVTSSELEELDQLSPEQQAFLRTLAIVNPVNEVPNNGVRRAAQEAFDVEIRQSNIGHRILDPLAELGYIEWKHNEGAPNTVSTTEKFTADVLDPVLARVAERVGMPRNALRTSFSELESLLQSETTNTSVDDVIETAVVKFGYLLDLDFVGWAARAPDETEVTAVFDRTRMTVDRWQLTFVRTDSPVTEDHISRAVGMAEPVGATTILIVSRQGITSSAKRQAAQTMRRSRTTILTITVDNFAEFEDSPETLRKSVKSEVELAHRIQSLEDEARFAIDSAESIQLKAPGVLAELEATLDKSASTGDHHSLDQFIQEDQ